MDFSFTEVQSMLRDAARRYVETQPFEAASKPGADLSAQKGLLGFFAEMGWLALLPDEASGGLGQSMQEVAILAEELGRGLISSPFHSAVVIGPRLIAGSDFSNRDQLLENIVSGQMLAALATEESQSRYNLTDCRTRADRTGTGYRLSGRKILIPDGAIADKFIVTATATGEVTPALFLVSANSPGVSVRTYLTIDSRLMCDLHLDDAELGEDALLASGTQALKQLEMVLDEARISLGAEALGLMEATLAMTRDYLTQRRQFGQALANFQVLTHRLADMYVMTENARAMLFRALSFIDSPAEVRSPAISATMKSIIDAGEFICGQAVQLHGGIGMADEHAISHFYRRSRAIALMYGDLAFHTARYRDGSMPTYDLT